MPIYSEFYYRVQMSNSSSQVVTYLVNTTHWYISTPTIYIRYAVWTIVRLLSFLDNLCRFSGKVTIRETSFREMTIRETSFWETSFQETSFPESDYPWSICKPRFPCSSHDDDHSAVYPRKSLTQPGSSIVYKLQYRKNDKISQTNHNHVISFMWYTCS